MRKIRTYIFGIIALISSVSTAQDFHLSMYDAAPIYLNPALTGVIDGDWRVHGHFRTQWRAVNFKPYNTGLLSFDMPYKKWGFGGQIVNYGAGIGNYNVLQATVSAGYTLPLDASKDHNLSLGAQAGMSQKSIETPLLTFDEQYTTNNGGGFDQSLSTGEQFAGRQSFIVPEFNFGALYYYSRQQARLNPFFGVSGFNLVQPKETFLEGANDLPFRLYVHTGTRINITETFYVIPKVLFMRQKTNTELTIAGDVGFYLTNLDLYLLGGLTYRNLDAFVFSIGARKQNFIAKIAYDINASSLSPASTGRGGFELSLTYTHKKKNSQNVKICPRL